MTARQVFDDSTWHQEWTTSTAAYNALVTVLFRSEVSPHVCPPDTDAVEEFSRSLRQARLAMGRARRDMRAGESSFWCWEEVEET